MATLAAETTMGRKKSEGPKSSPYVSVKIGRAAHAKLRIICGEAERDIADMLTELATPPIERAYKQALDRLNQKEKRGD